MEILTTRQSSIIIGQRLKKIREEKGFSQEKIAKFLNLSCFTIESWEYGETPPPDISYINRLAEFYGVDVDYFINGLKRYESDA